MNCTEFTNVQKQMKKNSDQKKPSSRHHATNYKINKSIEYELKNDDDGDGTNEGASKQHQFQTIEQHFRLQTLKWWPCFVSQHRNYWSCVEMLNWGGQRVSDWESIFFVSFHFISIIYSQFNLCIEQWDEERKREEKTNHSNYSFHRVMW